MSTSSFQQRIISTNGINMKIVETGPGDGPCVVLIHGWPESWYSWRHQLKALSNAGYRVIAPDMRGFGDTDAPEEIESYNLLNLVEDIKGVLRACGVEQAVAIGHDWGALVAWHCALVYPEQFRAVAAFSVPHLGRPSEPPTDIWKKRFGDNFYYILYHQEPGLAETEYEANPAGLLKMLYTSPTTPRYAPHITDPHRNAGGWIGRLGTPKELPDWLTEQDLEFYINEFRRSGFRGGLNYYRNFDRNWKITSELNQVLQVPALFVAGSEDLTVAHIGKDQLLQRMKPFVPQLRDLIWLEGSGHWIQQEQSELCNEALLTFLGEI
jgi:pimeloyl-ACP methyl ester carboxylesterase